MDWKRSFKRLLSHPDDFSHYAGGLALRKYQAGVARAIASSVLKQKGLSFVIIFPRQSGKNELQAQIESYLLMLLQNSPAEIVKISPTWKPQSMNAMRRLERVLRTNVLTKRRYKKESGYIFRIGEARVTFLSGQPGANILGATASTLLMVDEAQDIQLNRYDKDIAPMAASTNATRAFWGTAWDSSTLLARERRAAQAAQELDGLQRVFIVDADTVSKEVPAYGSFVQAQILRLGRSHPLVRTQFYCQEIDAEAGMFNPQRLALMNLGDPTGRPYQHARRYGPEPGKVYAMLIDVAGEDEAAVDGASAGGDDDDMVHPDRDATALTVVEVDDSTVYDELIAAPTYRVVDRCEWVGVKHTAIYGQLKALREHWGARFLVIDSTGVGAGLASFLQSAMPAGECRVIPFLFNRKTKSDLGWKFLAVVETGRFKDYGGEGHLQDGQDGQDKEREAFIEQLEHCQMHVRQGRTMAWGVPDGTRSPRSGELVHDDWILSAALCAVLDDQPAIGRAESGVVSPIDPLADMSW